MFIHSFKYMYLNLFVGCWIVWNRKCIKEGFGANWVGLHRYHLSSGLAEETGKKRI